jgi:hypothetical protein
VPVSETSAYEAGREFALAGKPLARAHKLKPLPYLDWNSREEFERGYLDAATPRLRGQVRRAESRRYFFGVFMTHWLGPFFQSFFAALVIYAAASFIGGIADLFGAHFPLPIGPDCDDEGLHCVGHSYDPPFFNGLVVGATVGIFFARQHFVIWGGAKKWMERYKGDGGQR